MLSCAAFMKNLHWRMQSRPAYRIPPPSLDSQHHLISTEKQMHPIEGIKSALHSTLLGVIMKTAHLLLLAGVAATTSLAAGAAPSNTDEARAETAERNASAEHGATLRPLHDSEVVSVTDTDSARRAAAQANARRNHDSYLAEVLRAGTGVKSAPIKVTDTDSARAAAAQKGREQELLARYSDYVKMQARAE